MKTTTALRPAIRFAKMGIMVASLAASTAVSFGQNIINSSTFFNPDFEVRRAGTDGVIAVTTDLLTNTQATQTNGGWTLGAKGLVQAGVDVGVASADIDLYAYTATIGDSLVFGRRLETETGGLLTALNGLVAPVVANTVGASVINSWSASSTVTGLNIVAGQTYTVNFDVATGAGLNVNAFSAADFSIFNGATPISTAEFGATLDLLGVVSVGPSADFETVSLTFLAQQNMSDLTFNFSAATVSDANVLGGITGNQNVMTFTNFAVAPVPEPGSASLVMAAGVLLLLRRRSRVPA